MKSSKALWTSVTRACASAAACSGSHQTTGKTFVSMAELDRSLADQKMIVLCTHLLQASRAVDVLDVARAHQRTTVRRNGDWEFLETPQLRQAKQEGSMVRLKFC